MHRTTVMEALPQLVFNHERLHQAAKKILRTDMEELPVVNSQGRFLGIITKDRLLQALVDAEPSETPVNQLLEMPFQVVEENQEINPVVWHPKYNLVWVTGKTGKLVGMIRLTRRQDDH